MDEAQLPEPPACPDWCQSEKRTWDVDLGIASQICQCALPAGADVDGRPATVTLRRYASYVPGDGIEMEDAKVRVEVFGDLSRVAALNLAGRLLDAADLLPGDEQTAA